LTVEGSSALTNLDQTLLVRDNTTGGGLDVGGTIGFAGYESNGAQRTFGAIKGGKASTGTTFNGYLAFYTRRNAVADLDERIRITHQGDVGIGLTNPEKPLHVYTSEATPVIVERTATNNTAIEYRNSTSSMWAGMGGNARGWGVADAADVGTQAHILVTRTDGELLVNSTTSTGTASQKLQVTGGAYVSGDVGIGLTAPTAKLEIPFNGSAAGQTLRLGGTDNLNGDYIYAIGFGNPNNTQMGIGPHGTNRSIWGREGITHHIHQDDEWTIKSSSWTNQFGVQGGTGNVYMRGSVGIGTTNPSDKLHVQGDIRVHDPSADTEIKFGTDTDTVKIHQTNFMFRVILEFMTHLLTLK
jgi:hypothetical protein